MTSTMLPLSANSFRNTKSFMYLKEWTRTPSARAVSLEHEDKLLHVLRGHKKAIGQTLADLLGINLSICMN